MSPSGWIPSAFDGRDIPFSAPTAEAPSPEKAALQHPFRPRDQRAVPCCVSIAVVTAMEILDQRRPPASALSPLFHYHVARRDPNRIEMLDFRTALQSAVTTGVARSRLHAPAYDEAGARARPSAAAYEDAEKQKLVGWDPALRRMQYELLGEDDIVEQCRASLAAGIPLLIGFWLTSAYQSLTKRSPLHGPPPRESAQEGHAVVALGYDDSMRALRIKDSRGERFADGGSWWLPYDTLETRLVHEIWALRKINYD